jgi:hypothetical protein
MFSLVCSSDLVSHVQLDSYHCSCFAMGPVYKPTTRICLIHSCILIHSLFGLVHLVRATFTAGFQSGTLCGSMLHECGFPGCLRSFLAVVCRVLRHRLWLFQCLVYPEKTTPQVVVWPSGQKEEVLAM